MIDRYPILAFVLTCLLAGYLGFALFATSKMAAADKFTGCKITVADSLNTGFVSQLEVSQECDNIMQWIKDCSRDSLDIFALENKLRASDKVENVNVAVLNDGSLAIDVVPMHPVARVFDGDSSYYINAGGKHISADPRYHLDVPVVVGRFSDRHPAANLLPLLSHIAANPELDALVSTVKQEKNGDIVIIPTIRGHVINFGDTANADNKFARLRSFYRQVLPVRGWETYDTISVKWRGQIVASHRDKSLEHTELSSKIEEFDDIDDQETMISPLHLSKDSII